MLLNSGLGASEALNADPKGYYRVLGLDASASAEKIKFAFRKLAKDLHPDVSTDADAKIKFQAANEAYQILSDPEARARYDSLKYETKEQAQEPRAPEPVKCSQCGNVTAQPRYVIYRSVVSLLITTIRNPIQGIFCADCGKRTALKASLISALAGWWGFPWGPIYTVAEICRNAAGGLQPPGTKEKLLWTNALAFLGLGQFKLSYALAREVRKTANYEIGESATKLMEFLRGKGINDVPPLHDSWRTSLRHFAAHLMLLAALPAAVLFVSLQNSQGASNNAINSSWMTMAPPPANSTAADPTNQNLATAASNPGSSVPMCATPPYNGAILQNNSVWAEKHNSLEIRNGGGGDAIIKIRDPRYRNLARVVFCPERRNGDLSRYT